MESTVIDLTGESPRLLREGAISRAELESVIGSELIEVEE
jgi:tRNA A37 threonylcarbamoyladenosine synthetase subunit TsaC/SUA5/YrdC